MKSTKSGGTFQYRETMQSKQEDLIRSWLRRKTTSAKLLISLSHMIPGLMKKKGKDIEVPRLGKGSEEAVEKNVKVIPFIVGTLGATTKRLLKRLKEIGLTTKIVELQRTVLLHSARILRKVLGI